MASLIENLIQVLDEEDREYNRLLELGLEKVPVIVKGDIAKLQELVTVEQNIVDTVTRLEAKREECIEDIANVLAIPQTEFNIDLLLEKLDQTPAEQEELGKVRGRFRKTMDKLIKVNESNKMLLRESIDMIEFELNISRSVALEPLTANYGKDAYSAQENIASGGFDAKQ